MEPENVVGVAVFVLPLQVALRHNILLAAVNDELELLIQAYFHNCSKGRLV